MIAEPRFDAGPLPPSLHPGPTVGSADAQLWRRRARWACSRSLSLSCVVFRAVISPQDPLQRLGRRKAPKPRTVRHRRDRPRCSRVIWGARASLLAGLVSVGISLAIGVPFGLIAGYLGRWPDALISRLTDAMLACPFLILAIALAAFLGPSLSNAMVAIGVAATPIFIRLTRAQVLAVKVEDYIEAARAVGNSHLRIALRHVLPNVLPPIIVQERCHRRRGVAEASLSS